MTLKLSFHGAAHTVTGSCFLLEADDASVLIDCGMFQGSKSEKELNYRPFPFSPGSVTAMILTHAHIDHSGLIPKLVKGGFSGPVFATRASVDLCSVMLPDSGFIQESEVAQLNRRNEQRGKASVEAIYTAEDAVACLTQFRPVDYGAWVKIAAGVRARFWNAGHLLGSASVEIEAEQAGGPPKRLLFSGDIGPDQKVLEPDPEAPGKLDYIICESTYGATDRTEVDANRRRDLLRAEIERASSRKGALIIPSFAVERTQELLVDIAGLMESGSVAQAPIFIDSPLATKATAVFEKYAHALDNGAALTRAVNAPNVRFTESVEQSKAIGRFRGFHIIIAASGMCEAGRIRHHLKNWLWREEGAVLLVGYQAQGTLGRILHDGATHVRIQGEDIQVRARIHALDFYSGHADAQQLTRWIAQRGDIAGNLFLVHGEDDSLAGLSARVGRDDTIVPHLDEIYDLTGAKARLLQPGRPQRMDPMLAGRPDWHNDASKLILDISDQLGQAPDEKTRAILIRRLRRALESERA